MRASSEMATSTAQKLFKEGIAICKRRSKLETAEKKLLEAVRLDPSLAGAAYAGLAAGADARLQDRQVIVAYQKLAILHLSKLPTTASSLLQLARVSRVPLTKAGCKKALAYLGRAEQLESTEEVHAEKAQALEALHWLVFGGWTLGFPHSTVRRAKEIGKHAEMLAMWRAIADSYERAGARFKTDRAKWKRWLGRV